MSCSPLSTRPFDVVGRMDVRPDHPRTFDDADRSRRTLGEVTSLCASRRADFLQRGRIMGDDSQMYSGSDPMIFRVAL